MKKKILIIDDELGIVRLLSMRLKMKGYEIFTAYDGLMGVKAAGGIRTLADAEEMVKAGASRMGTSASVRIVREAMGEMTPEGSPGNGY